MKIHGWDKWQSYRSDRGQPPWIKVHRCLMRNEEWVTLTDSQRGQLIAIWLLAADNNGQIPNNPRMIEKLCFMTDEFNLEFFINQGYIDDDANMTPT